jgi:hypothetical protein
MRFDRIDWNRAFFKTYYEKRSFGHLLVNFNRIWVIHISLFWFYTAYNAPTIYQPKQGHSSALTWSATALGGAVATIIMILATLAEFSYIPTTWNNTSHLTRRLLFLLVTLALTAGPTFYIRHCGESAWRRRRIARSHCQYWPQCPVFHLNRCDPAVWDHALRSGVWRPGRRVASKSRKYSTSRPHVSNFHNQLSDPTFKFSSAPGERLFMVPLYSAACSSRNRTFS